MRKILESIFVGIVFGFATEFIGEYLPADWQFLIETKIIWLLPAFLIAFNMPLRRRATDSIIVSTVTLIVTAFTYYSGASIFRNYTGVADEFINGLPLFLIAGVITGYVAYLGHSATKDFIRYASINLLPALYTGDGIEGIIQSLNNFELTPEIITKVAGGFVFYLLISGQSRFKPKSGLSYLALTAVITTIIYMV